MHCLTSNVLAGFLLAIVGFHQSAIAQEIQPEPEYSKSDKFRIAGPSAVASKIEAARRFAFLSTKKPILDEFDFDLAVRGQIRGEFQNFQIELASLRENSKSKFQTVESPDEQLVLDLIDEVSNCTKAYSQRIKLLVGEDNYPKLTKIMRREYLANRGLAIILTTEMSKEIGLSQEQVQQINEIEKRTRELLSKEMLRIRAESHASILDLLEEDQKRKLEKYLGDDFEK